MAQLMKLFRLRERVPLQHVMKAGEVAERTFASGSVVVPRSIDVLRLIARLRRPFR